MKRLIKSWKDLVGLENDNYFIVVDLDFGNAWIRPKDPNKNSEDYWRHNSYLSTHAFYGSHYKDSTELLQKFGFNVVIDNWDKDLNRHIAKRVNIRSKSFLDGERDSFEERNINGDLISLKTNDYSYFIKYDKKGNKIYGIEANGIEWWREYDNQGNEIYYKTSEGSERWSKYDDNGNLIYLENSNGKKEIWKYDENNNKIYHEDCKSNYIEKFYYDKYNNLIKWENNMGDVTTYSYEYYTKEELRMNSCGCSWCSNVKNIQPAKYIDNLENEEDIKMFEKLKEEKAFVHFVSPTIFEVVKQCPKCGYMLSKKDYDSYPD